MRCSLNILDIIMNILSIDYGIIASLSLRGRKMNLGLNDIINIVIGVVFIGLSIPLFFRWKKLNGKVIIADLQCESCSLL